MSSIVALIPARSGSKRIKGKNIKRLGKHPLLAYTIEQARQSGIFGNIIVSTDSEEYEEIALYYGAGTQRRANAISQDNSPDIEWIKSILIHFEDYDYFAILRPTNPFRTPEMIRKAWGMYDKGYWLKAIQPVSEHPDKMWVRRLTYTFPYTGKDTHMKPTQVLEPVYIQNGSVEIRPTNNLEPQSIQGFHTEGLTGYDLNTEKDWIYAEWLIANGKVKLIDIDKEPYEPSV